MTTWIRRNLFRSLGDAALTVVVGTISAFFLFRLVRYVFVTGRWQIVDDNLALYLHKVWPAGNLTTFAVTLIVLAAAFGLLAGTAEVSGRDPEVPFVRAPATTRALDLIGRLWPVALLAALLLLLSDTVGPVLVVIGVAVAFVAGRLAGLRLPGWTAPVVGVTLVVLLGVIWVWVVGRGVEEWGGAHLNVFFAAFSIVLCFPLGLALALGRRSALPVVRLISTVYIESFRGVPLFVLLLMSNIALGFFVPQQYAPNKVVRAIVVFTLFTAAYVAEIVRGGLQSVPRGQVEAGRALGLSPVAVTRRIVLPQALRNVMPAMVGQFISLFKDTTLAGAAMGFTDLLAAADASTSQSVFRGQGLFPEALAFVMLVFWVGSYTMSNESQRLEKRLGVGQR